LRRARGSWEAPPAFVGEERVLLILRAVVVALPLAVSLLVPSLARAGCCRIVKTDPATASVLVRACTPDLDGNCLTVLFEGVLELDESQEVCTAEPAIVYQEEDAATALFGELVGAFCDLDREVAI
jgi:hypothetical protein